MNNLTTRKIVLGMLMTLVLAFGVEGVAEAITLLKPVSEIDQSKRLGQKFEITFTATLQSNAIAYNTARKRVSDHNDLGTISAATGRIDSSGYRVYEATNSREYRHSTGATALTGDLFVDPRPSYNYVSGNTGTETTKGSATRGGSNASLTATSDLYVNTSGQVVDGTGKLVYTRTGAGTRFDNGGTPQDTADDTANDPYVYTLAEKQLPDDPIAEADRFDYNEESIAIQFTPPSGVTAPQLIDTADGQPVTIVTDATGNSMIETSFFAKLRNRVTLSFTPPAVGTYTIVITDSTIADDLPAGQVPTNRQNITFTLRVTPAATTIAQTDSITPDIQRVSTDNDVEPVSVEPGQRLTFAPADGNNRIRYEVVRGSGTLYVGTLEEQYTTPSSTLSAHQASDVYLNTNGTSNEVQVFFAGEDRSAPRATIIFEYKGQPVPTTRTAPTPVTPVTPVTPATPTQLGTITVSPATGLSGAPGEIVQLGLVPITAIFTVTGDSAFNTAGGLVSATGSNRQVLLPDTAGFYSLTVSATGYTSVTVPVTVTGAATTPATTPATIGSLSITLVGARSGTQQGIQVTAQPAPTSALVVTLSGVINPPTVTIPAGESSVTRVATLLSTTGAHTPTVSATGYTSDSVTVPATGSQPPQQQQPQQQQPQTVGPASSVQIRSEVFPSGTVNTPLAQPLVVQVLDRNGNGVGNIRVTFRVTSGQGRLSQRGSGRAIAAQTNVSGEARAAYTPLSASSTVRATAAGVSQTVTFTITASGATDTGTRDTGVTPSREISPVVHVGAAQRPPMLWVDGGKIYALVDANVKEEFVQGVDNALNIAVGGGKVYWTEKTGDSGGTVNSANLNGSGVTELASIFATPMGIAVDTPGSKLYWTNSRGRIQSANLDGSGIANVLQNLEGAMDIALAGGNAYWTQGGNVRFVNLRGQKQIRNISTGTDTAGSLAIGGGKVYWTEMTGESGGTVNSANLNGSGAMELTSILAAPMGIAVDGSRSKLYWTNSRGRVQSANLDGSKIQNVVSGLGSPGDMVLSNSIAAPAAGETATGSGTTASNTKSNAQYDVNGDGKVDNTDAGLVSDAMNTTNAKYDVNGDGVVNFLDLLLVFDNRDPSAAAAPTIVGMQLSAAQIDVLQEQIDLLIATGDRSPAAMRTLIYLQQLIATARPEKTQLLANYPNPFNPETWIPYELATDTTVKITIYNTQGVVIRTLELGHQSAGYYTGRDRAAYWDGRNALGEQVASGIYFYQFETDDMSSMRKMVILK